MSAKFRGQELAGRWGSPIPSAHFLSREHLCPALLACFALSTYDRPGQKLPTCCQFSSRKPPSLLTSESLANVRRPGPR